MPSKGMKSDYLFLTLGTALCNALWNVFIVACDAALEMGLSLDRPKGVTSPCGCVVTLYRKRHACFINHTEATEGENDVYLRYYLHWTGKCTQHRREKPITAVLHHYSVSFPSQRAFLYQYVFYDISCYTVI